MAAEKKAKKEAEEAAAASSTSDRSDEVPPPAESEPAGEKKKLDFPTAQRKATVKAIRPDAQRVIETVFVEDIHKEWKDLEKGLELGEKRSEHAYAQEALDKAAGRAYRAHRLYLTARAALEEWELENEVIFGAMLSEATRSLQKEKEDGIRSKQITDADVKSRVATLFPDEHQAQEKKRRDFAFMVKSLERLAEIWLGKQRDLQALVGRQRG